MKKVTDNYGYIDKSDIKILESLCEACANRTLPEFQAGKFCMEDYCPGLLAQLAEMKPVPFPNQPYTLKDVIKALQDFSIILNAGGPVKRNWTQQKRK